MLFTFNFSRRGSKTPSNLSYYKYSLKQLLAAELTGIFLKQGKVIVYQISHNTNTCTLFFCYCFAYFEEDVTQKIIYFHETVNETKM